MLKPLLAATILLTATACQQPAATPPASATAPADTKTAAPAAAAPAAEKPAAGAIYDVEVETIDGKKATLKEYAGKTLLIVNVASECGYTRQYPGLQALWEAERANGLVVLGFPSNDFGGQEPGTNEEIAAFCSGGKYKVDFPLFAKIQVKAGAGQHPLYAMLTGATGEQVSWNFNKFLVNGRGEIVGRFDSKVEPDSAELKAAIAAAR